MIQYPSNFLPCPEMSNYGTSIGNSNTPLDPIKGRSHHKLKDTNPPNIITLQWAMSVSQFSLWQSFWEAIGNGEQWFLMDGLLLGNPAGVSMEVHATGPFEASFSHDELWTVRLEVQGVEV